jgi:hypothetical protein
MELEYYYTRSRRRIIDRGKPCNLNIFVFGQGEMFAGFADRGYGAHNKRISK